MGTDNWHEAVQRTIAALDERRAEMQRSLEAAEAQGREVSAIRAQAFINEHDMHIEVLEHLIGERDTLPELHPDLDEESSI
jgi:hypothetical protein